MKYFSDKIIYKKKLIDNYNILNQISNKNICAVLKANAYGHNAKIVCKILSKICKFYAVENLYEAIEIRKQNSTAIILVLGYCINYKLASKYNISVTVDCLEQMKIISKMAVPLNVHIKINSGMNRLGVKNKKEFYNIIKIITKSKTKLEGVYTHFFDCKNRQQTYKQINIFKKYINQIPKDQKPLIHIGGSGMINYKLDFVDYIRCGISLFGYLNKKVSPCMGIKSRVIKINNVCKNEYIGYDSFYKTDSDMKIGVIPLGYADGISPDIKFVFYKTKKIKIVGKVCMDMFMIDITKTNIKIGDVVTVFNNAISWSNKNGQTVYQVLTKLNSSRTNNVVY